jgi:similar to stage IV sporulation protein
MKSPYALLESAAGRAECRVTGVNPALFLNRCAAAGLRVDAAEPENDMCLRVVLPLRELKKARRLALRSQCELSPLRETGAEILARRLLRRWVPVSCLLALLLLLAWSRLFIWEIEVRGNETVSTGAIRGALLDCGVGIGTYWPDLVSDNLRSRLLIRLPRLAWATVNIHGSRAEVIVRERVPKPELFDEKAAVDLVAERTGFVTEVRALNGTAVVHRGSAVMPGDVLISGGADGAFSGQKAVHAVGSVTAETYYTLMAAAPATETVRGQTETVRTRWALLIGKKRVNFYRNSSFCPRNCDKINSIWECKIEGLFTLPVAVVRERFMPWEITEQPRDLSALRRSMEQQLHGRLLTAVDGGEIEQETFTCSTDGGRIIVCLRARCSEDIAKEQRK